MIYTGFINTIKPKLIKLLQLSNIFKNNGSVSMSARTHSCFSSSPKSKSNESEKSLELLSNSKPLIISTSMRYRAKEIKKLLSKHRASELRIRELLGDSPDTSKALRMLLKQEKIERMGVGGRKDPYIYTSQNYDLSPPGYNSPTTCRMVQTNSAQEVIHSLDHLHISLALLCSTTMGGDALFPTYEVHIINDLPTNSHFFLLVRCQSKDDDFGMHKLESGEEFYWRFKPNIIKTTLFFCHFYWDTKDAIFNVYDRKLDDDYCYKFNTCYWSVRDDGFYFSGDNTAQATWSKFNDWTP
ncbi:unnamed protein product [Camellia sinensis]